MLENHPDNLSESNPTLGKLISVNYVKFSLNYFLPHFGLLIVFLLGLILIFHSETGFKKVVSVLFGVAFSMPFLWIIWMTLRSLKSELRIYEKGFIYKNQKTTATCRWNEIRDSFGSVEGRRSIITSLTKKNGEKIGFAYKMQGLDKLEKRHDEYIFREENSDLTNEELLNLSKEIPPQNQDLGEIQDIYHVKFSISYFFPIGIVFLLTIFGVGTFLISRDILAFLICALPLVILFCSLAVTLFRDRKDELTVYQNGFTYRTSKGLQSCLWDEIADYSMTNKELGGIQKKNNEWILFANELEGLDNLKPRLRTLIK